MVICFVTVGDLLLLDLLGQLPVSELVFRNSGRRVLLEDPAHVTEQFRYTLRLARYPRFVLTLMSRGAALTCG